MKEIKTEFQTRIQQRNDQIIAMFDSMTGARSAIYKLIAEKNGVSKETVQKVILSQYPVQRIFKNRCPKTPTPG